MEGVNKVYGTTILLSAATAEAAGPGIATREIDTVAVYGRAEGVQLFELRSGPPSAAEDRYAAALALYRQAAFSRAAAILEPPGDGPARWLMARCRALAADPPAHWQPVTQLDTK